MIREGISLTIGRMDSHAEATHLGADFFEILEPVGIDLTRMFGGFTESAQGEGEE